MKKTLLLIPIFCLLILANSCDKKETKILIFSKTAEFRHSSIEKGQEVLAELSKKEGLKSYATEDAAIFNEEELKNFSVIVFLNTTGDVLNNSQQRAMERFIQAGGGFVGIHSATDTEYEWPWYNKLVGAYFKDHPAIQKADIYINDPSDICCNHLGNTWTINEEWYNFHSIYEGINVIGNLDEESYKGGTNGIDHPIIWQHEFDGGRSFYCGLGHLEETFENEDFQKLILKGLRYARGNGTKDYSLAHSELMPDHTRFQKEVLDFNLDEPMELAELEGEGILYIERRGAIKLFDYETNQMLAIDTLEVFYANEDGLLGLAVDPNFIENRWIYLFYSPRIDEAVQYVSRFDYSNEGLQNEKILLQIPVIRACCHSGGGMEFDTNGLLYIGIGDNTNPFESAGYAPIDERPGRALWDAQKSAGNTNDLRGKILRIKPEIDGSYTIPEGNLFPLGTEKTRPEIYVMGCRNPFRISIDPETNHLYWGDVGPDAGAARKNRGPKGMGEFNQAKTAGNFGWPYSRGNNQMYVDFDFSKNRSGRVFKSDSIINDSPNNTGLSRLPVIEESMIWYGYEESKEFPWLAAGGVNPMSGPIIRKSKMSSDFHFPDYFDGKWLVYEWMRDWIYVVDLDENGNYIGADHFMPEVEFSHPMDMEFSKDGYLYVLEYGQKWNARNLDARLSRIKYLANNRPPLAKIEQDKKVGSVPLTVQFSGSSSVDFDKDKLKYIWTLNDEIVISRSENFEHIFDQPGLYEIELEVLDEAGNTASSKTKVISGNDPPEMEIVIEGNNTIYQNGRELSYMIKVSDKEDGSTDDQGIDPNDVKVTFDYIPEGEDLILASLGHQQNVIPKGLELINNSDCKACHGKNEKVNGPSYVEIANRYDNTDAKLLVHRVIKGSQGVWGETMMSAHPQPSITEVEEMVKYILSLDASIKKEEVSLPLQGKIKFDQHLSEEEPGKYVLMASYLDKGNETVPGSNLSIVKDVMFRASKMEMEDSPNLDKELGIWEAGGRTLVGSLRDGKWVNVGQVSLEGLKSIRIGAFFSKDYHYGGRIEVRKGDENGDILGTKLIDHFDAKEDRFKSYSIPVISANGLDNIVLYYKNENKGQYIMNGDWVILDYE